MEGEPEGTASNDNSGRAESEKCSSGKERYLQTEKSQVLGQKKPVQKGHLRV